MIKSITDSMTSWLGDASSWQMGEIIIRRWGAGFELSHFEDANRTGLEVFTDPADARRLALTDDAGGYRPLKTAPNLRHGWKLTVPDITALRLALDGFYPAMLGVLRGWESSALQAIPLRETLGRQSGMYAITRKISDIQADAMIGEFCASRGGCLKTILWQISPEKPITSLPPEKLSGWNSTQPPLQTFPLLCQEACNLLVARAREVVKAAQKSE